MRKAAPRRTFGVGAKGEGRGAKSDGGTCWVVSVSDEVGPKLAILSVRFIQTRL